MDLTQSNKPLNLVDDAAFQLAAHAVLGLMRERGTARHTWKFRIGGRTVRFIAIIEDEDLARESIDRALAEGFPPKPLRSLDSLTSEETSKMMKAINAALRCMRDQDSEVIRLSIPEEQAVIVIDATGI